jgi:hypothetical protein
MLFWGACIGCRPRMRVPNGGEDRRSFGFTRGLGRPIMSDEIDAREGKAGMNRRVWYLFPYPKNTRKAPSFPIKCERNSA